jgi:hypothetical protein
MPQRVVRKEPDRRVLSSLDAVFCCGAFGTWARSPAREEASDDPLGRSTPHGAVLGFIRAAGRGDYDQAASYLNTTDLLIVALAISVALLAHLIDIGVWAVLFVMCGEFFGVPSRVLPLSGQLHHLGVR